MTTFRVTTPLSRTPVSIGAPAPTRPRQRVLNSFTREDAESATTLAWLRSASATEVWRIYAEVPRLLGEELREYLAGSVWDDLLASSAPLDDVDGDEIDFPATDTMILLQYEPRDPDLSDGSEEVHRVCIYYEPAPGMWRIIQWTVPAPGLLTVVGGVLVLDADGDWAFTDDPSVTPDGWLVVDADGELALEDSDPTDALRIRMGEDLATIAY